VQRLLDTTNQMIEQSRTLEQSDAVFDLEPEHTSDTPRLRRLSTPVDQHPEYWAYGADPTIDGRGFHPPAMPRNPLPQPPQRRKL
jgi:ectoine hydroxylase